MKYSTLTGIDNRKHLFYSKGESAYSHVKKKLYNEHSFFIDNKNRGKRDT